MNNPIRFLLLLLLLPSRFALGCTAIRADALQGLIKKNRVSQLVFFASWCSSCKESLQNEAPSTSYFIAVFDEHEAATKAFRAFFSESARDRCYWDQDGSVAKAYGVKALPAKRVLPASEP